MSVQTILENFGRLSSEDKISALSSMISDMSLKTVSDLIVKLEELFGVSSAMPVGIAGPSSESTASAEPTEWDVVFESLVGDKIGAIKLMREVVSGLGLADAKAAVEGGNYVVAKAISKADAEALKGKFGEIAKIALRPSA